MDPFQPVTSIFLWGSTIMLGKPIICPLYGQYTIGNNSSFTACPLSLIFFFENLESGSRDENVGLLNWSVYHRGTG